VQAEEDEVGLYQTVRIDPVGSVARLGLKEAVGKLAGRHTATS